MSILGRTTLRRCGSFPSLLPSSLQRKIVTPTLETRVKAIRHNALTVEYAFSSPCRSRLTTSYPGCWTTASTVITDSVTNARVKPSAQLQPTIVKSKLTSRCSDFSQASAKTCSRWSFSVSSHATYYLNDASSVRANYHDFSGSEYFAANTFGAETELFKSVNTFPTPCRAAFSSIASYTTLLRLLLKTFPDSFSTKLYQSYTVSQNSHLQAGRVFFEQLLLLLYLRCGRHDVLSTTGFHFKEQLQIM